MIMTWVDNETYIVHLNVRTPGSSGCYPSILSDPLIDSIVKLSIAVPNKFSLTRIVIV